MKQGIYELIDSYELKKGIYKLSVIGDASAITTPGQFINIKIDDLYLRRPISVCDLYEDVITIIFKVVGKGTDKLSRYGKGKKLDILTGLGNGYDVRKAGDRPMLIGGGIGVPPLYLLAKELISNNKDVSVVLGFNSVDDVILEREFKKLGCHVNVATVDGSYGKKGFVTDAMFDDYSFFYTCGPHPMLKAVYDNTKTGGEFSFEERMGCGFGACMGCSIKTKDGYKRICKDGPVLDKEEIVWED